MLPGIVYRAVSEATASYRHSTLLGYTVASLMVLYGGILQALDILSHTIGALMVLYGGMLQAVEIFRLTQSMPEAAIGPFRILLTRY